MRSEPARFGERSPVVRHVVAELCNLSVMAIACECTFVLVAGGMLQARSAPRFQESWQLTVLEAAYIVPQYVVAAFLAWLSLRAWKGRVGPLQPVGAVVCGIVVGMVLALVATRIELVGLLW